MKYKISLYCFIIMLLTFSLYGAMMRYKEYILFHINIVEQEKVCDYTYKNKLIQELIDLEPRIIKKGASKEQQEIIDYAYAYSNYNEAFIYMIESENDTWDIKRVGFTGDRGIPQFSPLYFNYIIKDPRFNDYKFQIEQGYKLFMQGVKFYGVYNQNKVINRFIITHY